MKDEKKMVHLASMPGIVFTEKEYESLFELRPKSPDEPPMPVLTLEQQKELAKKFFRVDIEGDEY